MNPNSQDLGKVIKRLDSLGLSGKALGHLVKAFVEKKRQIQFTARGDSMFPFIRDGDAVLVSPYHDVSPEPGDIAAFIDSCTKRLVVHRIMRISQNGFVAKGDNCFYKDSLQPLDNILGYVSKINARNYILWGINYIKIKNYITFFSRLGLTLILGRILKRAGKLSLRS